MLVLIVAYCVKLRRWIQDRRYEKKIASEQAERGEVTLVSQVSDEVPFGIRALIEDAEVEGVWNSRALTPLHQNEVPDHHSTPSGCPASASNTRRNSSVSSTSIHDAADIGNASPYRKCATPFARPYAEVFGKFHCNPRSCKSVFCLLHQEHEDMLLAAGKRASLHILDILCRIKQIPWSE